MSEHLTRIQSMATGSETWDLSPNDIAALKWILEDRAELRAAIMGCADALERDARSYPDGNFPSPDRFLNRAMALRRVLKASDGKGGNR